MFFFLILKVEVCLLWRFSTKEILCLNTVVNFSNRMVFLQRSTMTRKQYSCLTSNGKGDVGGKLNNEYVFVARCKTLQ